MFAFLTPETIEYVQAAILLVAALLVLAVAVIDVRTFKIPNKINLGLLGVGIFYALTVADFPWVLHIGCGVLMFLVGAVLFQFRMLGGGDVKFLSVVAFWAGLQYMMGFAVVTALMGGIISAIYLLKGWLKSRRLKAADPATDYNFLHESVPYGVAIAAGAVYVFLSIVGHLELVVRM